MEGTLRDYDIVSGWGHIRNNGDLIPVRFKVKPAINNTPIDIAGASARIVGSIKKGKNLCSYILVDHLELRSFPIPNHKKSTMETE